MRATRTIESPMPEYDRRQTAASLEALERLIDRMNQLGADAEDAAARVTKALGGTLAAADGPQQDLVTAMGDVIDIVTERSRLAHEAHRLIVEIRNGDFGRWLAMGDASVDRGESS